MPCESCGPAGSGSARGRFNRPTLVPETTRNRVQLAATELGYVPGGGALLTRHTQHAPAAADGLTELWLAPLEARRALSPGSPVPTLDRLLRRRAARGGAVTRKR